MFGLTLPQLALKAGPWIAVAVLCGLFYVEHLRLGTCEANNARLTLMVKQADANISDQNKAISDLNRSGNILSKELLASKKEAENKIKSFVPVSFPKDLTCHEAVVQMREVLK